MNPTCVRATVGWRPSASISANSTPGAAAPVHDTVITCVMRSGSKPDSMSAAFAASIASGGARRSNAIMRSAVDGACAGSSAPDRSGAPVRGSRTT
jgi:hypothetical protein